MVAQKFDARVVNKFSFGDVFVDVGVTIAANVSGTPANFRFSHAEAAPKGTTSFLAFPYHLRNQVVLGIGRLTFTQWADHFDF